MTFSNPPMYRTFILRLWEERNPDPQKANSWRFTLEDPETHTRHAFQSLDGLLQFLQKQMAS
ncbi:MAG: hypothetical protein KF770_12675 [Anaerolineae bacterium]|nr:hypothetical protein [Anaerolineae bacterium]